MASWVPRLLQGLLSYRTQLGAVQGCRNQGLKEGQGGDPSKKFLAGTLILFQWGGGAKYTLPSPLNF